MNKSSVMLFLVLGLLVFSGFVLAANETNTTNVSVSTTTINGTQIENAFACLATQVKPDCTGTNKVQDIALTILASPSGVTQACYDRLISSSFKKGDCFGETTCNIRDTALAILAINHVGQDTKAYQNWLKNNTRTAEDLIWYLQEDSIGKTTCRISYDSVNYDFNVLENKKIETAAGNCLSLANSNYWFQITPNCYNKKFTISCDAANGYIATLSYKQPTSPILYVLSETKSAQMNNPIELTVKSLCFGENVCNYEASAWAAIALDKTGNDIQDYLPYLISGEDANKQYLPAAFLQILKDFSEYGTKLIQQQTLGSWEAENTAYNTYYDSGLALLALTSSNQQKVADARSWLLNRAQDATGCWNKNNIRDTAMILWGMEGRTATVTGPAIQLPECANAGFFCIASDRCPTEELLPNYYCGGVGKKCCKTENLESCESQYGQICASGKECTGLEERASDTDTCCLAECETPEVKSDCDIAGGVCRNSCSSTQTEITTSCGDTSLCCKAISAPAKKSSYVWLWIILILLIILVILGIIYKDKVKVWIYKIRSGFKEDKGKGNVRPGGFPPSAPFSSERPTMQRPPMRPMQPMPPQQMRPTGVPMNRPPMRR